MGAKVEVKQSLLHKLPSKSFPHTLLSKHHWVPSHMLTLLLRTQRLNRLTGNVPLDRTTLSVLQHRWSWGRYVHVCMEKKRALTRKKCVKILKLDLKRCVRFKWEKERQGRAGKVFFFLLDFFFVVFFFALDYHCVRAVQLWRKLENTCI